jgi:hypothetical protein
MNKSKQLILYMRLKSIFFAATALTLAACSNESESELDSELWVALTVNANIAEQVTSRATATAFEKNDSIGISVKSGSNLTTGDNVKYISSDGSKFAAATGVAPIYFKDGKKVTFRAYFPYNANVTSKVPSIEQSTATQANQAKFDFLYGEGTGDLSYSALGGIDMTFEHKMAKVTFTIVAGTGASVDADFFSHLATTYTIDGIVNDGSFNTSTGVAAITSNKDASTLTVNMPAQDQSVTATKQTAASSIIIYPQTPKSLQLTITYNDVKYIATATIPTVTSGNAFAAGNNYAYTVTLNQTGLTISKSTITNWTTNQQQGTNAEYEYPYDVWNGSTDSGLAYEGEEEELKFKN